MNSILNRLQGLDYAIIIAYLVILIGLGVQVSFGRKQKTGESLFLANKSLSWYSIGFNMWGTNVGPSMLLAFASIGYATGIVAVNFEWYAFVFLFLLAIVFAPRYLAANVSTMPEFMGNRYGDSTRNILAWYALIKILISWLSLGLFAGGFLVRQILGIPLWQSVIVLVLFAGFFAMAGGLKAIAKVNVFQMILLIGVSLTLSILGIHKAGGIAAIYHNTPGHFWNLIQPASDPKYPWYAILLGYPVSAIAFFCTDQAMVQSVLGAKNLEQGQLGVNFIGWLKILSLPLFILTGIICFILFPHLKDPNEAYMTMVTSLFPPGMNGLVIVVLIAVLVGTIGSSLNALSTVFTTDVYVKKINPNATNTEIVRTGRITVLAGCLFAIVMALAIDSVKGLNLFDVFQAVLGFIAPPLAVVFLLSVFWRRTTKLAVNLILSAGSAFSLGTGVLYLWVLPPGRYTFWPHYLVLSFLIFTVLFLTAVLTSLADKNAVTATTTYLTSDAQNKPTPPGKNCLDSFGCSNGCIISFLQRALNASVNITTIAALPTKAIMKKIKLTTLMLLTVAISNAQSTATWIWYPGDYEIWLSNNMQNRRTDRGSFFPVFWKVDSHYPLIDFHKDFTLAQPEEISIYAEGKYNVKLDGQLLEGTPGRISVPAGKHRINIKVFNQTSPPAIFIQSKTVQTDATWLTTYEDKEWIDETGKTSDVSATVYLNAGSWNFNEPANLPSRFKLLTTPLYAVAITQTATGKLVDFGKETFGFIKLHGIKGKGNITLNYGESKEEALSDKGAVTFDKLSIAATEKMDSIMPLSKAFRYVKLQTEGGISIDSISMQYEYADVKERGSFKCSDELINRIYDVSKYTFRLATREFFIDGIKRDRWVWSGDAYQSYLMNYYLYFDSGTVKRTMMALRGKDPVTSHINTIMDYTFYWFLSIYDYYQYTGDKTFITQFYPRMQTLMQYCLGRRNKDGLMEGLPGDWIFIDWAEGLSKKGEVSFEQMLLCRSLETMALCAKLINNEADAATYQKEAATLKKKLFDYYWNESKKAMVHSRIEGKPTSNVTRYANMFGIFFNYFTQEQKQQVKTTVLLNDSIPKITTPYMRFYELEALCAMGEQTYVLQQMKDYWGGMLALGATTFWEEYNPEKKGPEHYAMYGREFGKSLCHAWGASPIYLLGKYYIGVHPTSPAYATYTIEPQLGGLQWMQGEVPTPKGKVQVYCSTKEMKINADEGTGTLLFTSTKKPASNQGVVQLVKGNSYEMKIEAGKDYTISYQAK